MKKPEAKNLVTLSHLIGNSYEKKYAYFFFLGGFFVEAGSYDAESRSDSLHFEINRGWKVRQQDFYVIIHLSLIPRFP
jgi:hypothetical protein